MNSWLPCTWLRGWCVFLLSGLPVCAQTNDDSTELRREAGSYFLAMEANLSALKRGDVLIRYRSNFDAVDDGDRSGLIDMQDQTIRYRFDLEKNHHLYVNIYEFLKIDFERQRVQQADAAKIHNYFRSFVWSNNKGIQNDSLNGITRMNQREITTILEFFNVPDFRFTGFVGILPRTHSTLYAVQHARLTSPPDVRDFRSMGDQISFSIHEDVLHDPGKQVEWTFLFDAKRLVLIESRAKLIIAKGNQKVPGNTDLYKWKDFNGLQLPIALTRTMPSTRTSNNRRMFAEQKCDTELIWLSVNQEFEAGDFDEQHIEDYGKMMQLVQQVPLDTKEEPETRTQYFEKP